MQRNSNNGGLEVYDISNNQITGAAFIGTIGLNWQFSGVSNFSGVAGETDLLLRNVNAGALGYTTSTTTNSPARPSSARWVWIGSSRALPRSMHLVHPSFLAERAIRLAIHVQSSLWCQYHADAKLKYRIVRGCGQQRTDRPHALALLRPRRERPRDWDPAEQRYELAPSHSITSSVSASSVSGISRPRAFAVLRLITSSNWVGCTTGRSAGLVPLRDSVHVLSGGTGHAGLARRT